MSETQFDLIIIGSGPGGYTGAIRAALKARYLKETLNSQVKTF